MTHCNKNIALQHMFGIAHFVAPMRARQALVYRIDLFQECGGFAASMACLLAVWPRSFACSDRTCIWLFTNSDCSCIRSFMSLARTIFWANAKALLTFSS